MAITHTFVSGKSDGADATLVQPSNWNATHTIANSTITRAMLAGDAIGWEFLGKASWSSGSIIGPLTLSAVKKHMVIRMWIVGYAGGGGIASLQLGGSGGIDTGAHYCSSLIEGTTLTTTSVSVTGIRISSTAITGPRFAEVRVTCWGSSIVKRVIGETNSNSVSAATVPTQTKFSGLWVDTTNQIQTVQLTAFSSVTGTTPVNFLGGEFEVWGRDDE